jgi:aspartyl-tRNA(Asn)/glutamyl-tRNA(Gln) amidotransferase subunit B
MPELPEAKRQRFVDEYNLSLADATSLTASPALARIFETTVQAGVDPRLAGNWIVGEFSAATNRADIDPDEAPEDLKRGSSDIVAMPPKLRKQLAELGLL